jgi:hypothetical protein
MSRRTGKAGIDKRRLQAWTWVLITRSLPFFEPHCGSTSEAFERAAYIQAAPEVTCAGDLLPARC